MREETLCQEGHLPGAEYYQKVFLLASFTFVWSVVSFLLTRLNPYLFLAAFTHVLLSIVVSAHHILAIAHGRSSSACLDILKLQVFYSPIALITIALREYIRRYYTASVVEVHTEVAILLSQATNRG